MATTTAPLSISDAAEATGLSAHTLRYYERAGLLDSIDRDHAGHRRYDPAALEWIVFCTRLRATGMPIRRIREYAELVRAGEGNEHERLALLEAHRDEIRAQLAEVERNLALIDYKIGIYSEKIGAHGNGNGARVAAHSD
jgi:DNA-binding transcriptional MerR regulator